MCDRLERYRCAAALFCCFLRSANSVWLRLCREFFLALFVGGGAGLGELEQEGARDEEEEVSECWEYSEKLTLSG